MPILSHSLSLRGTAIRLLPVGLGLLAGIAILTSKHETRVHAQATTRFTGPTSSQPLALSADDSNLIVANPDNDSVTVFEFSGSGYVPRAEVKVGREPNGVVLLPAGTYAYVANTLSGTVSVLAISKSAPYASLVANIPVETEPYGLALTPNGRKLYVTNARSNSVTVIDTTYNTVIKTIENAGAEPRGIAITNNGDDNDNDETVLVTQFLAVPATGRQDGEDDSKIGLVTRISTATDSITDTISVQPLPDTGFKAAGDAIGRIAPPAAPTDADFQFLTGAYPNQLNNIAIHAGHAYLPSTGASPNGPVRFDVNVQSLLSALDLSLGIDVTHTTNMNLAVKQQTTTPKLFLTQPWAIAFRKNSDDAYIVSAASNVAVKVRVNPVTGESAVQTDPADPGRVFELKVGKNPRGIVVNAGDSRAYVMNYISRDVTVIDLTTSPETVLTTFKSADLPQPGTQDDIVHIGKELYNTSVGEFDPPAAGQPPIVGRMSANGWGACSACHPNGLSDNVVWIFASGPRRTVPQHADFDPVDHTSQRALNWSGIFDEEEDFELNIRGVSGGQGLLVAEDGITPDTPVAAFTPPNAGRRQLKVRGVGAWDAIKTYIRFGIRAPLSPVPKTDPDVIAGEAIFKQNNCQKCHGGPQWTSSRISFVPPPAANAVSNGQLIGELRKVGTFDATAKNEVRATAAPPLGDDGFVPPSLLSISAFPKTFFHNGSADSLDAVLNNVAHRVAGVGSDLLDDAEQRRKLGRYLLSIDAATPPIAP